MLVWQGQGVDNGSDDELSDHQSSSSYTNDDDEESQLSALTPKHSIHSSSWSSVDNVEQPSVEQASIVLEIPSKGIELHSDDADDAQLISSILGNIKNLSVLEALKRIVTDPLNARQINIKHQNQRKLQSAQPLTSTIILYDGLLFAGFDHERLQHNNIRRKTEWFKAFYGAEHTTIGPYLVDLGKEYPNMRYRDCLMTLNWLTLYATYPVLSGRWGCCEKYIGNTLIDYGMKMAKLARKKITVALKHDIELGRSVDCATFMTHEFRLDPSAGWFDYKTHSSGLKYEFCLAVREPRITWISGPHKPSIHDITVFRGGDASEDKENWDQHALYFQLEEGEKCIGDSGYIGEPDKVAVTKDQHSSEFKEFMARIKNRQETFHWRLKSFNILGQRFRHGVNTEERMRLHQMAVWAVAGIVQYDYDNGHPPFDVD